MTAVGRLVDGVPRDPEPLGHLRRREPLAVEQVEHLAVAVGQVGDQAPRSCSPSHSSNSSGAAASQSSGSVAPSFAAHS